MDDTKPNTAYRDARGRALQVGQSVVYATRAGSNPIEYRIGVVESRGERDLVRVGWSWPKRGVSSVVGAAKLVQVLGVES
jgi:hypothetical protein